MQTRHNTALLEKALEHVVQRASIPTRIAEAELALKQSKATSQRRLATGAAIALAAVGIGLGIFLGFWKPSTLPANIAPEVSIAEPKTFLPTTPVEPVGSTVEKKIDSVPSAAQAPVATDVVTLNFSKFATQTVALLGKNWTIEAGHQFNIETDKQWSAAWCYSSIAVENVLIKIDLATRLTPSDRPSALVASPETLKKAGLDDAAALALATRCPWLDGKTFKIDELITPPGRESFFTKKEAAASVEGRTLVYDGEIDKNFLATLKGRDFDKLQITSPGGLIVEAMSAGYWLRQAGKSVDVSGECLSACVFVLAGGATRTAPIEARVGVHRFYNAAATADPKDVEVGQQLSSVIIQFLDAMSVDQALFHAMAAVPAQDMAYLDHDTLRQWRLLSSPENATLVPLPPPVEIPTLPSTPSQSAFVARDGYDAMGNDLPGMPVKPTAIEACESLCKDNEKCQAFSYNKQFRACFLKSKASVLIRDTAAFAGYRSDQLPVPRLSILQIQTRRSLVGKSYRSSSNSTYVQCVTECDIESQCTGFSHDATTQQCVFYSAVTGSNEVANVSSGIKLDE